MEQSIKSKGFEHRLLLIMWGLLLSLSAFAQQITVKGHVVDATGEPVIGASVIEGKSTNGTITDIDGNFSLNVSANSALTISFVGYKTQTVSVNGKTALKVTLQEDTEVLDEVVVVGYGTMKKSDLTGRRIFRRSQRYQRLSGSQYRSGNAGKSIRRANYRCRQTGGQCNH